MKKICVLGGGAIGSCVSASLTDAGLDVILVDQWADHINKIRRDGLSVTTKEGEKNTKVSAYHMSDLAKLQPQFDLILMASKRARQLSTTSRDPLVEWDNDKPTLVALREIEEGLLDQETLEKTLEEDVLLDEFAVPSNKEDENIG